MVKVLYDSQIFDWQLFGGISKYFCELIWEKNVGVEKQLSVFFSNNEYLNSRKIGSPRPFFPSYDFKYRQALIIRANRIKLRWNSSKFDVFHPTYYDPYFLSLLDGRPFVLTVHDMIHEMFPESIQSHDTTARDKKTLCDLADHIITVSENTKRDLVRLYSINGDKISVVHLAQSFPVRVGLKTPDNYILFIGQRQGYKNFTRTLYALQILRESFPNLKLVCTGAKLVNEENALISSLKLTNAVINTYVKDDRSLQNLYQNALCFVFPSEYEGFGIPILEAFASGCPVVISDIGCFREVAKDAALFFDPIDVHSIERAIRAVISNQNVRNHLIDRGHSRLREFSWKMTSLKTAEIYTKL